MCRWQHKNGSLIIPNHEKVLVCFLKIKDRSFAERFKSVVYIICGIIYLDQTFPKGAEIVGHDIGIIMFVFTHAACHWR